jgi:hypothetical protein
MLDVTFLPLLFTMTVPFTWLPTDYYPSVSRTAWSSATLPAIYNPSDIDAIDPDYTASIMQITVGTTSANLQIYYDVNLLLQKIVEKNNLVAQLESFSKLPSDWAGDETQLPSTSAIESAKTLLSSLSTDHVLPQLSPSADGEIGFTWLTNNLRVEALLYPDKHLVWLWSSDGIVNAGGEGSFNGSFPDGLLDKIATAEV